MAASRIRSRESSTLGHGSADAPSQPSATPPFAASRGEALDSAQTLSALLDRPWWRLRFPAAMEAAYAQVVMQARSRRVDLCNLIGSALFWPLTAADVTLAPQIAGNIDGCRVAVMALLCAVNGIGLWRGERRRPWELDASISLCVGTIAASGFVLTRLGGGMMGTAAAAGQSLMIMFCALVVRQQFRHVLGLATFMVVGLALAVAHLHGGSAVAAVNLRLLSTTAMMAVFASFMLERRERHAHVLRLCAAERKLALKAGLHTWQRLSHCDALTGLANRRHFDRLAAQAWMAAGVSEWVALLLLDIDHFKRYNDDHGHPAGDACLQAVARAIDEVAYRHGGTAARIGGEEFAVLLRHRSESDAAAAAEAMCAAVRALAIAHATADAAPFVTVSIGVAAARPRDGKGYAHCQDAADRALYLAKAAGRNQWVSAATPSTPTVPTAKVSRDMPASASASTATSAQASRSLESPSGFGVGGADESGADAALQRLRTAIERPGWRLCFTPQLEADFDRAWSHLRGPRLCILSISGVGCAAYYQWLSTAMLGPLGVVVNALVQTVAVAVVVPLALLMLLPMRSWLRESIFGMGMVALAICFPLVFSVHPVEQAQIYTLGLFLLPMFSAVIAEQPWLATLLSSLAVLGAAAWLLHPADDAGAAIWAMCAAYRAVGTAYAVVAAYLLERSTRRNHLLSRLDESERAALVAQSDRLRVLALIDPVTGIANRRLYEEELSRLSMECSMTGQPLALLLLDVDHFKRYNDLYGHPAGDACLRVVAQTLVCWASERSSAGGVAPLPARIGGEEFGVLLPGLEAADALHEGRALCAAVARLTLAHGGSPTADCLTVSIGVASTTVAPGADRAASTALMAAADAALYRAKSSGRNCACL